MKSAPKLLKQRINVIQSIQKIKAVCGFVKTILYSDEKDEWGRHKSYGNCTEDEKEFYKDETEEATYWDAMAAAYDDF